MCFPSTTMLPKATCFGSALHAASAGVLVVPASIYEPLFFWLDGRCYLLPTLGVTPYVNGYQRVFLCTSTLTNAYQRLSTAFLTHIEPTNSGCGTQPANTKAFAGCCHRPALAITTQKIGHPCLVVVNYTHCAAACTHAVSTSQLQSSTHVTTPTKNTGAVFLHLKHMGCRPSPTM